MASSSWRFHTMQLRVTGGANTMEFAVNAASWVVSKALSPDVDGFLEAWADSNGLGPNMDALELQLLYAQAMLESAQGREIRSSELRELLLKLRGLAYYADDVLDELEYFRIDDEVRSTHHATTDAGVSVSFVHGIILNCRYTCRALASKHNGPQFHRVEIARKMEDIVGKLQEVCARASSILNQEPYLPQTTPQTTEPKLYGRGNTLKSIVDGIALGKYSANKLTVLSIVGPGGIGKTTFTQHLYQEVKSQFDVLIWVVVSLNFNANRLAHKILKLIPTVEGEKENASQEELIEQRLRNKRFLLVLDDIWKFEEDEWKKLLSPFCKGEGKGNMVIVTTRFPQVAKMVTSRDDCLVELGRFEPADLLEFFGACGYHEHSWKFHYELIDVGKEIWKKLKGSPLATKTVGRLLRNQLTLEHWTRVLESRVWDHQTSDSDIMPALKLSYDYLPFHLQQCFIYCALFPKDYEFDRNELIHLWIGLDILPSPNQNKAIEDVGHSCLEDLVNYGFLNKNERDNGHPYYVLHDLLRELAVRVSSDECLSIFNSFSIRSIHIPSTIRHLSITIDEEVVKDRETFEYFKEEFSSLGKRFNAENLRTLMLFGKYHECLFKIFSDLFKEATALRIVLCKASHNVEDLLPNLSELVHLRYLRIMEGIYGASGLSNNISRLYQLKILDVEGCSGTSGLLRDINNLRNLQYLLVSDDKLHSDILEVGKLIYLKELQRFEVRKETNGFELKQLGKLLELQVLGIYNLENVDAEEAAEANLRQKDKLQELRLHWGKSRINHPIEEDYTLECLKPHSNLRKLYIRGHGGAKCSTWLVVNLQYLEHLYLNDVGWRELPFLDGLHMLKESGEISQSQNFVNLKRLELVNVWNLKKIVGIGSCHLFSHLEVLIIKDCKELLELSFSDPTGLQLDQVENMDLSCSLQELEIVGCPNLLHVPPVPWTRSPCSAKIRLVGSSFEEIDYTKDFKLKIQGKDCALDSTFWKVLAFDNLIGLEELSIQECPPLPLDHLKKLSSLKRLITSKLNTAVWMVENECVRYDFPVEYIEIIGCNTSGKELTRLLYYFPKLSSLNIQSCQEIRRLSVAQEPMTAIASSSTSGKELIWRENIRGLSVAEQLKKARQQQQGAAGEGKIDASMAGVGLLLLPPQLEELELFGCDELSPHPKAKAEEAVGTRELHDLHSLRSLKIRNCPRFLSSYSSSFPLFPASLQVLMLYCVKGTKTPVPLSNLTSLTQLCIIWCGDLRVEGLWPLLAHGRLTQLSVRETPNLFVDCKSLQPLGPPSCSSSNLQMDTDNAEGVLASPICTFLSSSLTTLVFNSDYEAERFTEEQEEALQLLTSLQDLQFLECDKMQRLPAVLHRLTNLKRLLICGCNALCSLPKDGLPSSLQELRLQSCKAIQLMPKDVLPSSLQVLEISGCPAIQSLAKLDSLQSSLRELNVKASSSDDLRRLCQNLRGTIPIVRV
ncbi:hypothetical protein EJB05_14891, partial [Eragrostis curvula]